jgi:hypothetical protein
MPVPITDWSFVHHPLFQSLALPALACALGLLGLRAWRPAWAPWGAALGLAAAFLVWPGPVWPPTAHAQWLPWIALLALAAGLALARWPRLANPLSRGRVSALLVAAGLLALVLAVLAGLGGSLLLAQLALMPAAALAVLLAALWLPPHAGVRPGLAALLPIAAVLLALALLVALQVTAAWRSPGAGHDAPTTDDPYYTPGWR